MQMATSDEASDRGVAGYSLSIAGTASMLSSKSMVDGSMEKGWWAMVLRLCIGLSTRSEVSRPEDFLCRSSRSGDGARTGAHKVRMLAAMAQTRPC